MIMDNRKRKTENGRMLIDRAVVEQTELQILWCPHHQQTNIVQAHQDSREEGMTKPIPLRRQNIWHGSSDPQKVVQLHHEEHPDWLHHCLVWQLLSI